MNKYKIISKKQNYQFFDLTMTFFVLVLVISNIASSAKIIDWGISLFGTKLAFDAGTILFPISYIFGDIITEVYGYQMSKRVIWSGFFCLLVSSIIFWTVKILPGEANWEQYAGQSAFDAILGGMSTGGIVIASLLGYWTGEFTNSTILAKMKIWTGGKFLWMRTIGSTLVGQIFDTSIFVLTATIFGVFPWNLFFTLLITNYIFKCGIETIMTPITYYVVGKLKTIENEDHFDYETVFNPFIMNG